MDPVTDVQGNWCSTFCQSKKIDEQAARDMGKKKIWVYLNKNMLDLAKSQKVEPHEFSYLFYSGHELVGVACYDEDELNSIGDHETNVYDAWWREVGRLNISLEPHTPATMRRDGILSYLCDRFGLSTEKNIALAIGDLTVIEGFESPIELINSL